MKTNILRTAGVALIACLMNGFVTKAQVPFYFTVNVNDKVVLETKYVAGDSGVIVKESEEKYTYDEKGDLLKKEGYACNPKYAGNDKAGEYNRNDNKGNWAPQYCIVHSKDSENNLVSVELLFWNKDQKAYRNLIETMTSQLNDSYNNNFLADK